MLKSSHLTVLQTLFKPLYIPLYMKMVMTYTWSNVSIIIYLSTYLFIFNNIIYSCCRVKVVVFSLINIFLHTSNKHRLYIKIEDCIVYGMD